MSDYENQRRRVQRFVESRALSKRQLALKAGIPPTTLTGLEWERWSPELKTLARLIRAIERWEAQNQRPPRRRGDGSPRSQSAA